jgi:hypothetical protein
MKVNVATDNDGNAYVLSFVQSDSSMWVTKYNNAGTMIFNTRIGWLGHETDYHYAAKKIRVYDRVYVLSRTYGPVGNNPTYHEDETIYTLDKNTGILDPTYGVYIAYPGRRVLYLSTSFSQETGYGSLVRLSMAVDRAVQEFM